MRLWRLSARRYANAFDGGYGLLFSGRWNSLGRPVTYCATSPSLCILEKLVHIEDPALMPVQAMIRFDVPDDMAIRTIEIDDLPEDWFKQESLTQTLGDDWHAAVATPLLKVPSAIVPLKDSPDLNVVINHRHPDASRIRIEQIEEFKLDTRLF